MTAGSRALSLVLGLWASVAFVILWVGLAVAIIEGGDRLGETWRWLQGLEGAALIGTWVLILPIGVGLWAANAGLPTPVLALVVVLLVAWTAAAWGGLARTLTRPRG